MDSSFGMFLLKVHEKNSVISVKVKVNTTQYDMCFSHGPPIMNRGRVNLKITD